MTQENVDECLPDFSHPIVEVARRVVSVGENEDYLLDEKGESILKKIIRAHGDKDDLGGGLLGLLSLAAELGENHNSPGVASQIFLLVGDMLPDLTVLKNMDVVQKKLAQPSLLGVKDRKLPDESDPSKSPAVLFSFPIRL